MYDGASVSVGRGLADHDHDVYWFIHFYSPCLFALSYLLVPFSFYIKNINKLGTLTIDEHHTTVIHHQKNMLRKEHVRFFLVCTGTLC